MFHFRDFFSLIFGHNCVHCKSSLIELEQHLCVFCRTELSLIDPTSEESHKIDQLFYGKAKIEKAISNYHFLQGGVCQSLVHHLKYHNVPKIGIEEGKILAEKILLLPELQDIDAIVPVPMTFKKRRKRGFNQSELIAKGLQQIMKKPVFPKLLQRKVQKKSQTKLNKFTRWQNINESFGLNQEIPPHIKHILLVDDVITTGATLESCANAIHSKHHIKISIASIAFAPLQA